MTIRVRLVENGGETSFPSGKCKEVSRGSGKKEGESKLKKHIMAGGPTKEGVLIFEIWP